MIVALNLVEQAAARGTTLDVAALEAGLGVPSSPSATIGAMAPPA